MSADMLPCGRLCWCSWPRDAMESMCISAKQTVVSRLLLQMSMGLPMLACGVMLAAPRLHRWLFHCPSEASDGEPACGHQLIVVVWGCFWIVALHAAACGLKCIFWSGPWHSKAWLPCCGPL